MLLNNIKKTFYFFYSINEEDIKNKFTKNMLVFLWSL